MTDPIYIVSGFPRSGTSMLMRSIEAGGIPCVYSTDHDDVRNRGTLIPDYVPNPHGFYETSELSDWPQHRGKCLKVLRDNIDQLPSGERLMVVYMRRNVDELFRSFASIMPNPMHFLEKYDQKVSSDLSRLSEIAECVALDYAAVVSDPVAELSRLNWPIDVQRAAATIDPSLYRHRGTK